MKFTRGLFFQRIFLFTILSSFVFVGCKDDGPPPDVIVKTILPEDTIIITQNPNFPPLEIPGDNPINRPGFELGRFLFFDSILSIDHSVSCGSCHTPHFAFVDQLKVSEGVFGRTGDRNAMPVFNLMWKKKLFWDGRANSLRHLAIMPVENELEMDETGDGVVAKLNASDFYKPQFKAVFGADSITEEHLTKALEQFLLAVVSDNSKFDQFNLGKASLTASENRGFEIATAKGCFNCHSTTLFHDNKFHATGMDMTYKDLGRGNVTKAASDNGKFSTPSLRNVEVTPPYMHDGRFKTLLDVINFYDNDVRLNAPNVSPEMEIGTRNKLSDQDKLDLIAFLNTLTDYTYLENPNYKNPFR